MFTLLATVVGSILIHDVFGGIFPQGGAPGETVVKIKQRTHPLKTCLVVYM